MPSQPTLRRLTIFDAVIRNRSAGAAAAEIGLSQPSVTNAMAKLEREVGARLLERDRSGSYPSRAGRLLHRRVSRMLRSMELAALEANPAATAPAVSRSFTTPQVRAHLAIAKAGSFRAAAQALGVAEPTLHRAARELEASLGAQLYRRTARGVSATPTGVALARHLTLALYEIAQALDELEAERNAGGGRVAAGCLPLTPKPMLGRIFGQLLREHPSARLEVEEAPHAVLIDSLRDGHLDVLVGALRSPRLGQDLIERPLFSDPHVLAARAGHPLARARWVEERDLADYAWVAPTRGTPRRAFMEEIFARLPRRPDISAETSSLATMVALLANTDCLTLVSRSQALDEFGRAGLVMLPVRFEMPERVVGVTTRRGWLPTRVQRRFLTLLREDCRASAAGLA